MLLFPIGKRNFFANTLKKYNHDYDYDNPSKTILWLSVSLLSSLSHSKALPSLLSSRPQHAAPAGSSRPLEKPMRSSPFFLFWLIGSFWHMTKPDETRRLCAAAGDLSTKKVCLK